jgi:hypothetical protein
MWGFDEPLGLPPHLLRIAIVIKALACQAKVENVKWLMWRSLLRRWLKHI